MGGWGGELVRRSAISLVWSGLDYCVWVGYGAVWYLHGDESLHNKTLNTAPYSICLEPEILRAREERPREEMGGMVWCGIGWEDRMGRDGMRGTRLQGLGWGEMGWGGMEWDGWLVWAWRGGRGWRWAGGAGSRLQVCK